MKSHLIFLLDSDSKVSYKIVDELEKYKEEPFSIFIGCTSDFGIDTFKLAKKTSKVFPKERIYLFPGNLTQALSSVFCYKTLAPEIMNGKNKDKYNKYSRLGENFLNSFGKKTEHFKYIITSPGSTVSEKLGISEELSDYKLYSISRDIIFSNSRKPSFVYFEAGSGSKKPISEWKLGINKSYDLLHKRNIEVTIGGGINSSEDLEGILADNVVISSAIERNPKLIVDFIESYSE